jgi:DnaJ-class molecular chaperone
MILFKQMEKRKIHYLSGFITNKRLCDICGGNKSIYKLKPTKCPQCYGTGIDDDNICTTCFGNIYAVFHTYAKCECERCNGDGYILY